MALWNLNETRARKYRMGAVALLGLTGISVFGIFIGLYYSSPFITLYSLMMTGIFLLSAFFLGGVGLTTVGRQGARVVYRSQPNLAPQPKLRPLDASLEHSEKHEGLRVDTEPPYMTDFPEEDHPPERGR